MKKVLLCLLGIVLMTIENSITNYIDIFGISFNLVLIYVTIISLYLDELEGGIIAAIIGLIKDITVGGIFGANALILFIIAYAIGYMGDQLYKGSYIITFVLIFIGSLIDSIVNIGTSSIIYQSYNISTLFIKGLLVAPIVNSLIGLVIYRLSKRAVLKLKED